MASILESLGRQCPQETSKIQLNEVGSEEEVEDAEGSLVIQ